MTRLHLPHAIEMKLYAHEIDVVILTPETVDIVGVLSSSLSLSVEFSIQDEAMGVARSAPQEAHYHSDVVYLLLMVLRVTRLQELGSRPTAFLAR